MGGHSELSLQLLRLRRLRRGLGSGKLRSPVILTLILTPTLTLNNEAFASAGYDEAWAPREAATEDWPACALQSSAPS